MIVIFGSLFSFGSFIFKWFKLTINNPDSAKKVKFIFEFKSLFELFKSFKKNFF